MIETSPERLVKYIRDGLVEQEHFGFIVLCSREKVIGTTGETNNYPFFLRSCAKPLQASLLIDFGMDKFFNMTQEEIALCCASHAGEEIHTRTAQNLLEKIGLEPTALKCGLHKPLSKTEQEKLLINGESENVFHNNCSMQKIKYFAVSSIDKNVLSEISRILEPLLQYSRKL